MTRLGEEYGTRIALRARLEELGFAATLEEIDRIRMLHSDEAILRALEAANERPQAVHFLGDLLASVRRGALDPRQQPNGIGGDGVIRHGRQVPGQAIPTVNTAPTSVTLTLIICDRSALEQEVMKALTSSDDLQRAIERLLPRGKLTVVKDGGT